MIAQCREGTDRRKLAQDLQRRGETEPQFWISNFGKLQALPGVLGHQESQMLQSQEISTRGHQWIVGHFPLAKEIEITPADSLLESGIVDSLGTLEIVMFLEKEFGLVVEDEDMVADHFETIQSIANFVGAKTAH